MAELTESFARTCLDVVNEAIEKLVVEPLADSANLDPGWRRVGRSAAGADPPPLPDPVVSGEGGGGSRPTMNKKSGSKRGGGGGGGGGASGEGGSSNFWLDSTSTGLGMAGDDAEVGSGKHHTSASSYAYGIPPSRRSNQHRRDDCWEAQRLYCPDYVWADEAISGIQRMVRNLVKHRFVVLHSNSAAAAAAAAATDDAVRLPQSVSDAADAVLLLLRHDLPAKLHHFRAAAEADAVVTKRLYLVKCEYRAPFRAFLEAHQSVQRAPSLSVVDSCLVLHANGDRDGLRRRKQMTERAVQDALHHPQLVEALELERRVEEVEIGMARMLLPFTELARFLDSRRARLKVIPGVVAVGDLPVLEELLRVSRNAIFLVCALYI